MNWHLGADHAGVALKDALAAWLRDDGETVVDHGTQGSARVDYPDFAASVARAVAAEPSSRGLLVCGSGIGVAMTANRFLGVRAVTAAFEAQAALAREHNDANVLCLGARITPPPLAERIVSAFRDASFEGGRHTGRVAKIDAVAGAAQSPQSR